MSQNETAAREAAAPAQAAAPETLNDERARRLASRKALYEAGQNPYPEHSEVTDHVADIVAAHAELAAGESTDHEVKIGGRIVAKRGQGKIAFLVLRDTSGDIQLFCRINNMSEEAWARLQDLALAPRPSARRRLLGRSFRGPFSCSDRIKPDQIESFP